MLKWFSGYFCSWAIIYLGDGIRQDDTGYLIASVSTFALSLVFGVRNAQ